MYGQFTWYELITPDPKGAEAFYGAVVGWTAKTMEGGEHPYTVFSAGDHGVAGMLQQTEEMRQAGGRPGWIGYIVVENVDKTAADLQAAGGKVHKPPTDVPGMLRFAVVADPQGVVFTVFTPDPRMGEPPADPAEGTLGTFGWRELVVTDWQKDWDFYAPLFGWTKGDHMDMGQMGVYQLFGVQGGAAIGGMMNRPQGAPAPGWWAFYIHVDSVNAGIERLKAAGGSVINGPHEVPGPMWIVQGIDPQGAHFSLLSAKP
jgi:predicted enzyme related to lactoylglutathione lyase